MNKNRYFIFLLICLITTTSCSNISNIKKYTETVYPTVADFYRAIKQNKLENTRSLYSRDLLDVTPADSVLSILRQIKSKFGNIHKYELIESTVANITNENKSISKFVQVYKVQYTSSTLTKETFSFLINEGKVVDKKIFSYETDFW